MHYDKTRTWDLLLLAIHLWLAFAMIKSGNCVIDIFTSELTANLGENFNVDGGFTISYCLFALVLVVWGSGRFGLDGWRQAGFKN